MAGAKGGAAWGKQHTEAAAARAAEGQGPKHPGAAERMRKSRAARRERAATAAAQQQ